MVADQHTDRPGFPSRFSTNALVSVVFAVGTCAGLGFLFPFSLASAVFDGGLALLVVAPPCALGFALTRAVTGSALEPRWQVLLGSAFGLGGTSLMMLSLGLIGALNRPVVIAIYAAMVAGSFAILASHAVFRRAARPESSGGRGESPDSSGSADQEPSRGLKPAARKSGVPCAVGVDHTLHREAGSQVSAWWWLALVPFLILAAHAAAQAPGFIWREEGFGYDVLEYHLQVPREFVESGRVAYLPHNVYAMFPLDVEMLYAAAMLIRGDAIEAAVAANFIHLLLGALAVQRHLDDAGQPVALQRGQPVGLQDGHLAFDQPRILQALDAAQAGGRRHMHLLGQRLVALGGVGLQQVEQLQVGGVQCDLFRHYWYFELKFH